MFGGDNDAELADRTLVAIIRCFGHGPENGEGVNGTWFPASDGVGVNRLAFAVFDHHHQRVIAREQTALFGQAEFVVQFQRADIRDRQLGGGVITGLLL